jgi:hypothetical protein
VGSGCEPNKIFQLRIGALVSGRRATKILAMHSSTVSRQHPFSPLVAQKVSVANDSPIGFGFRLTHLQNRHFEIKFITRAYRVRPRPLLMIRARRMTLCSSARRADAPLRPQSR